MGRTFVTTMKERPCSSRTPKADAIDKADLQDERAVLSTDAERMSQYWGCKYFETSAVSFILH